ncbi:TetR/AcrR family transcriptional regulator [Aquibacillus rhizosphaerae]|uniref:TetR/AcrR family transcriptional regulator n=1 Tax=Aquibacillus rhizosphaerae TaxID=3051431 RepID=A0ABT7L5J9_9BACI|nr:TetR/AcrR family transcriptional regulator [Aquibacillus sp. LR5S19]MDL4841138.1 TetR/AcrR family transcriptional regulator [Aquibacillus sp. LR5S19]
MNQKRTEIMEAAIKLFSQKGYFSTSMQEIASGCGISKGSLYKNFESKEDLLIQVFKYNHDNMFSKAKYINIDNSLVPKEKLRNMIIIEFKGILENKDYFNLISKSLPVDKNKQFGPVMRKIRAEMIDWHKSVLIQVYGSKIEPYIWDLVITLQGLLKEYIHLLIHEKINVNAERVADFAVFSIEAMINQADHIIPVLTNEMMKEFEEMAEKNNLVSEEDLVTELLYQLKQRIKDVTQDEKIRNDIGSTIALLEEELKSTESRVFLIEALIEYLGKWSAFSKEVKALQMLLIDNR